MFEINLSEHLPRGYDKITLIVTLAMFVVVLAITLTKMKHAGRDNCDNPPCLRWMLHPLMSFILASVCLILLVWEGAIDKDGIGYVVSTVVLLLVAVVQLIALRILYNENK